MSENKSVLEQVLEHILAEDEAKAKELLHGFMVEKSRDIYESLLDEDALEEAIEEEVASEEEAVEEAEESEEEAVEEAEESEEEAVEETVAGSPSEDFYDEVEANVGADESGVNEEDDEEEIGPELDMDDESEDKGEEEVEDRVDDLEAQLDELKAEFEKLMADDEDGDEEVADAEADLEDEMEIESFAEEEIDLDEEVAEEELEEATQFSKEQKPVNDASGDHTASPKFPKKESFGTSEKELFGSDGGEGSKAGGAKDNPASDNIGEEPKAHPAPKVSADKSESPIAGKVK
jgi:hypothetical protein